MACVLLLAGPHSGDLMPRLRPKGTCAHRPVAGDGCANRQSAARAMQTQDHASHPGVTDAMFVHMIQLAGLEVKMVSGRLAAASIASERSEALRGVSRRNRCVRGRWMRTRLGKNGVLVRPRSGRNALRPSGMPLGGMPLGGRNALRPSGMSLGSPWVGRQRGQHRGIGTWEGARAPCVCPWPL